ncbi:DUF4209 domain-containing protein [Pycnococcus provasolii]
MAAAAAAECSGDSTTAATTTTTTTTTATTLTTTVLITRVSRVVLTAILAVAHLACKASFTAVTAALHALKHGKHKKHLHTRNVRTLVVTLAAISLLYALAPGRRRRHSSRHTTHDGEEELDDFFDGDPFPGGIQPRHQRKTPTVDSDASFFGALNDQSKWADVEGSEDAPSSSSSSKDNVRFRAHTQQNQDELALALREAEAGMLDGEDAEELRESLKQQERDAVTALVKRGKNAYARLESKQSSSERLHEWRLRRTKWLGMMAKQNSKEENRLERLASNLKGRLRGDAPANATYSWGWFQQKAGAGKGGFTAIVDKGVKYDDDGTEDTKKAARANGGSGIGVGMSDRYHLLDMQNKQYTRQSATSKQWTAFLRQSKVKEPAHAAQGGATPSQKPIGRSKDDSAPRPASSSSSHTAAHAAATATTTTTKTTTLHQSINDPTQALHRSETNNEVQIMLQEMLKGKLSMRDARKKAAQTVATALRVGDIDDAKTIKEDGNSLLYKQTHMGDGSIGLASLSGITVGGSDVGNEGLRSGAFKASGKSSATTTTTTTKATKATKEAITSNAANGASERESSMQGFCIEVDGKLKCPEGMGSSAGDAVQQMQKIQNQGSKSKKEAGGDATRSEASSTIKKSPGIATASTTAAGSSSSPARRSSPSPPLRGKSPSQVHTFDQMENRYARKVINERGHELAKAAVQAVQSATEEEQGDMAIAHFLDRFGTSDEDTDKKAKKNERREHLNGNGLSGGGFGQMTLNKKFLSGAKANPLTGGNREDVEPDQLDARRASEFRMTKQEFKALPRNGDFTVFTVPKETFVKSKARLNPHRRL